MPILTSNEFITNRYLQDGSLSLADKGLIALMIACNCSMTLEKILSYCDDEEEVQQTIQELHDFGIIVKKYGKYYLTEELAQ